MERELKKSEKRKKLISSYYGEKDGPHPKGHTGTDFKTPVGTLIHSPVNGVVSRNNHTERTLRGKRLERRKYT